MAPPQARKACEVAIRRDQFAAVLDRQCRDIRVGHEWSPDVSAKAGEQAPMPAAWGDEGRARPIHQALAEGNGRVHRRWGIEDPWIRDDAQEAGEHHVRQRERLAGGRQRTQPGGVAVMLGRVLPVSVDQDIHVGQLHGLPV